MMFDNMEKLLDNLGYTIVSVSTSVGLELSDNITDFSAVGMGVKPVIEDQKIVLDYLAKHALQITKLQIGGNRSVNSQMLIGQKSPAYVTLGPTEYTLEFTCYTDSIPQDGFVILPLAEETPPEPDTNPNFDLKGAL